MKMLTPDQLRVKQLLSETITLLCKNGLHFNSELSVNALIGITLDQRNVFLVTINETVLSGDTFVCNRTQQRQSSEYQQPIAVSERSGLSGDSRLGVGQHHHSSIRSERSSSQGKSGHVGSAVPEGRPAGYSAETRLGHSGGSESRSVQYLNESRFRHSELISNHPAERRNSLHDESRALSRTEAFIEGGDASQVASDWPTASKKNMVSDNELKLVNARMDDYENPKEIEVHNSMSDSPVADKSRELDSRGGVKYENSRYGDRSMSTVASNRDRDDESDIVVEELKERRNSDSSQKRNTPIDINEDRSTLVGRESLDDIRRTSRTSVIDDHNDLVSIQEGSNRSSPRLKRISRSCDGRDNGEDSVTTEMRRQRSGNGGFETSSDGREGCNISRNDVRDSDDDDDNDDNALLFVKKEPLSFGDEYPLENPRHFLPSRSPSSASQGRMRGNYSLSGLSSLDYPHHRSSFSGGSPHSVTGGGAGGNYSVQSSHQMSAAALTSAKRSPYDSGRSLFGEAGSSSAVHGLSAFGIGGSNFPGKGGGNGGQHYRTSDDSELSLRGAPGSSALIHDQFYDSRDSSHSGGAMDDMLAMSRPSPRNLDTHWANRRQRATFTSYQIDRLEATFSRSHYVGPAERSELSKQLNINENIIQVWFQNRRQKLKKMSMANSGGGEGSGGEGGIGSGGIYKMESDDRGYNPLFNIDHVMASAAAAAAGHDIVVGTPPGGGGGPPGGGGGGGGGPGGYGGACASRVRSVEDGDTDYSN